MTPDTVAALTEIVADWVRRTPDPRALGVVGSQARGNPRPSSDLDLLILARDPRGYFDNPTWLAGIGFEAAGYHFVSYKRVDYGARWSYRLQLVPTAELELIFAPLDWACIDPVNSASARIVRDALRIIVDTDALFTRFCAALR